MTLALGLASSALDALHSLTSSLSSQRSNRLSHPAPNPFDHSCDCSDTDSAPPARTNSLALLSPGTLGALIAAQSQSSEAGPARGSPFDARQRLFSQIDADSNGSVSKTEFENAFGAGGTNIAQADDVFGKLDTDHDGSVSLNELASALGGHGHKHRHEVANGGDSNDLLTESASNANVLADNVNPASSVGRDVARTRAGDLKLTILPPLQLTSPDPSFGVSSAANLPRL